MLNPNPDKSFLLRCDNCHGARYIGKELCPKCDGEGAITVTPIKRLTIAQKAARQMAWILFGATTASLLIIALLHWLKLI